MTYQLFFKINPLVNEMSENSVVLGEKKHGLPKSIDLKKYIFTSKAKNNTKVSHLRGWGSIVSALPSSKHTTLF